MHIYAIDGYAKLVIEQLLISYSTYFVKDCAKFFFKDLLLWDIINFVYINKFSPQAHLVQTYICMYEA